MQRVSLLLWAVKPSWSVNLDSRASCYTTLWAFELLVVSPRFVSVLKGGLLLSSTPSEGLRSLRLMPANKIELLSYSIFDWFAKAVLSWLCEITELYLCTLSSIFTESSLFLGYLCQSFILGRLSTFLWSSTEETLCSSSSSLFCSAPILVSFSSDYFFASF